MAISTRPPNEGPQKAAVAPVTALPPSEVKWGDCDPNYKYANQSSDGSVHGFGKWRDDDAKRTGVPKGPANSTLGYKYADQSPDPTNHDAKGFPQAGKSGATSPLGGMRAPTSTSYSEGYQGAQQSYPKVKGKGGKLPDRGPGKVTPGSSKGMYS